MRVALSRARERSRYERELLAARTAADRAASRLTALQAVTAALSRALGVARRRAALLDAAVGPLGAGAATLWLPSDDGLRPAAARGEPLDAVATARRRPRPRAGRRWRCPARSALQGVLSLLPRTGAGADPLDPEVLPAVGQQAGLALDRALLHEQSASVAHELQHSLLAVDAPEDTRFAVATTYRPGVEMLEVGGDWYDVFLADQGVLAVVVGDVVGRGLGAATAMGQLRSAVRALSEPGSSPAAVLERLDRFVEQVPAAPMATVAYAELDLATGLVRLACAGHPPPLLVPRSAPPRLLWGGRSTPLGVPVAAGRTDTTVQLDPGRPAAALHRRPGRAPRRRARRGPRRCSSGRPPTSSASRSRRRWRRCRRAARGRAGRDDVCVLLL